MSSVKAHPHPLPSQSRVGLELSVECGVGRLSDCQRANLRWLAIATQQSSIYHLVCPCLCFETSSRFCKALVVRSFDVRVYQIGSASSNVDVLVTVSVGFCVECQC